MHYRRGSCCTCHIASLRSDRSGGAENRSNLPPSTVRGKGSAGVLASHAGCQQPDAVPSQRLKTFARGPMVRGCSERESEGATC